MKKIFFLVSVSLVCLQGNIKSNDFSQENEELSIGAPRTGRAYIQEALTVHYKQELISSYTLQEQIVARRLALEKQKKVFLGAEKKLIEEWQGTEEQQATMADFRKQQQLLNNAIEACNKQEKEVATRISFAHIRFEAQNASNEYTNAGQS